MNYKKLIMACLVPLMFVACSDANDLVPNAPSSEPNGPSSSSDEAPASSSSIVFDGSEMVYRGIKVYTVPYGFVQMYELDPVTFDTARSIPHSWIIRVSTDIDSSIVDSLSLKSPYVMFSTSDDFERRYNIVDIRESKTFAVDKKTYFESIRALYLMKSGMNFTEAKKQASKEVLEMFGSFADVFDKSEAENVQNASYRNYMAFINDFMKFTTEDTVVVKFEKCGNITCGTEFLKRRFLTESLNMLEQFNGFLTDVDDDELDYNRALNVWKARRNLFFLGHFVANLLDAGVCSVEKEGNAFEILDKNIMLTCRSGIWEFLYKKMNYSEGTMTDERDGKTYKTVTYDMNGKMQTWMAERLDYAVSELQVPCGGGLACGMYYLDGAFGLDTSIVESKESCVQRHLKDHSEYDSLYFDYECDGLFERIDTLKYRQHIKSVLEENGVYQGVCPDGWHIPTRAEVNSLLDYMVEWYNPPLPKWPEDLDREYQEEYQEYYRRSQVSQYLYSSLGNPSGFARTKENSDFYVVDKNNGLCAMNVCSGFGNPFMETMPVRCVKN